MAATVRPSPFLYDSAATAAGDLAIVQISRDKLVPVHLRGFSGAVDGYAEGDVLNTVFGSFPHSTLIGLPWGSQVRASAVDTGSRGRKRKRGVANGGVAGEEVAPAGNGVKSEGADGEEPVPETTAATSGFVHILRPTPELWTMSLPHRTQVVYTPDYSFVLQRLHALPGTQLIEAGAGSGSFTHASARAVFSGMPTGSDPSNKRGKVWSFELDEVRFEKVGVELEAHGLRDVVHVARRNVCEDGFLVNGGESPKATAVFLDLPAPWEALPHLSRQRPPTSPDTSDDATTTTPWVSPLDPDRTAYVCAFSPCIEQVTRTIATMRDLGWVDIDMVEIAHKKYIVNRERVGPLAGSDPMPRDVNEALVRLREVNKRTERYHNPPPRNKPLNQHPEVKEEDEDQDQDEGENEDEDEENDPRDDVARRPWRHAKLNPRPEAELKTHTSYLTFAVLPREWSDADEERALARWGVRGGKIIGQAADRDTRKRLKAEMHQARQAKNKKRGQ